MGDGRWEMGDGRWEMGDGRWEMGDGRWEMTVASPTLRLYLRSIPHIPLRYMWGFQQFTLLRSVSAYCGSEGVGGEWVSQGRRGLSYFSVTCSTRGWGGRLFIIFIFRGKALTLQHELYTNENTRGNGSVCLLLDCSSHSSESCAVLSGATHTILVYRRLFPLARAARLAF